MPTRENESDGSKNGSLDGKSIQVNNGPNIPNVANNQNQPGAMHANILNGNGPPANINANNNNGNLAQRQISIPQKPPIGLKYLKGTHKLDKPLDGGQTGKEEYLDQQDIGPFTYRGDFKGGIEPKFKATMNWTDGHTRQLSKDDSQLAADADSYLEDAIKNTQHMADQAAKLLDDDAAKLLDDPKSWTNFKDSKPVEHLAYSQQAAIFLKNNPKAMKNVTRALRKDPENLDHIKYHLTHGSTTSKEFKTKHMVKLDYSDKKSTSIWSKKKQPYLSKTARINERYKGSTWQNIKGFGHKMHQRRQANDWNDLRSDAIKETVANDLMHAMAGPEGDKGHVTQRLSLLPAKTNEKKSEKLLLDAELFTGDDIGKPDAKFEDLEKSVQDGFVVKTNSQGQPVDENNNVIVDKNGKLLKGKKYVADNSIKDLGRAKIKNQVLADVDGVGKYGQNKGRIGDTFAVFDTGKALESKHMKKRDIGNDFSHDSKFHNYSIFDDSPLSEKMKGVKDIKDMRDKKMDQKLFDDYSETFDKTTLLEKEDAKKHHKEIKEYQKLWNDRVDYVLDDVFKDRLDVYDFDFGTDDASKKEQRAAQTFDTLDGLEKLCSKTSCLSENKKVALNHPRVTDRKEWSVRQDKQSGDLEFTMPTGNARNRVYNMRKYFDSAAKNDKERDSYKMFRSEDNRQVVMVVPKNKIGDFANLMSNDRVMAYKHPERAKINQ
ncbi:MAG: hypothetical protein AAFY56_02100 [Pseudomonadota bacterium]